MNYTCPICAGELHHGDHGWICLDCGSVYPVRDDIPIFGNAQEIEFWTRYHVEFDGERGNYAQEVPAKANSFYGQFLPEAALHVLDGGGGGDGNVTADWAQRHPEASVHVMDLSIHGLKKVLRRQLQNMIPVCSPVDRRFPFPDNCFDAIISVFMVEHLKPECLAAFYREAHRVLRSGGVLVIATDGGGYNAAIQPLECLVRQGRYIPNDPTHINLMTPRQCAAGIRSAGFRVERRILHWVAGRHVIARNLYRFLPTGIAEWLFVTMYIIEAKK